MLSVLPTLLLLIPRAASTLSPVSQGRHEIGADKSRQCLHITQTPLGAYSCNSILLQEEWLLGTKSPSRNLNLLYQGPQGSKRVWLPWAASPDSSSAPFQVWVPSPALSHTWAPTCTWSCCWPCPQPSALMSQLDLLFVPGDVADPGSHHWACYWVN